MSALNDFIDEERALLVSIPVRAGYWISHIDDVPGSARDDAREQLALEKALGMIVDKTGDDRFINDIAEFALSSKGDWPRWSDNAGTVLADIPKALSLIESRLSAKDLKDYKSAIYRIAGVVAQAAHEDGCNNEAELRALLATLQELKSRGADTLLIHCDNSVVVEQVRGTAKPIARLASLFDEARTLLNSFDQANLVWIPRHRNSEADALARAALGIVEKCVVKTSKKRR